MELADLQVIRAIIMEGSISGAAKKLGYVQSNITARVRKLETELGTSLFQRHPKGVSPTEKGLLLNQYATDILQLAGEAVMAVKELDYPTGELKIGVVETVSSSQLFIQALSSFQQQYPAVTISLVTGTSLQNYERLVDHQLDGAFFTGELELSKLEVEMSIEDNVVLVTKNDQNQSLSFPTAPAATWVVFPKGCPFRAMIEEWVKLDRGEKANIIEVSTTETMLNCVRSGIGYTLLPQSALNKDEDICTHSIPKKYQHATTRLVRRSGKYYNKALTAFSQCLQEIGIE